MSRLSAKNDVYTSNSNSLNLMRVQLRTAVNCVLKWPVRSADRRVSARLKPVRHGSEPVQNGSGWRSPRMRAPTHKHSPNIRLPPSPIRDISPLVPPGFDCSKIRQFGINRMENFRAGAIMIHCGLAKGGAKEGTFSSPSTKLFKTSRRHWCMAARTWIWLLG